MGGHGRGGPAQQAAVLPVQPAGQDRLDAAVVGCADGLRAGAGGLQPVVAELAGQPHQAQAGSVALLGVCTVLHLPAHHPGGGRADALTPADELGRRPLQVRPVRGRHVLGHRGEATYLGVAGVGGDALAAQQHLQRVGCDAQLHRDADMLVRHRVVVALEGDVVVDVHPCRLELRQHHRRGRQRLQGRCVQCGEGRRPAAGQLLERALVQVRQQQVNSPVELGQAEEAPVAQPRQDPALDHLHADFDLGLVLRAPRARGQHGYAVVLAQLLHQPRGGGLVGAGVGDQCAGLVGHQQPGHAADEPQRVDDRGHPVGGRLLPGGAGVGVVRRAQHGHEHLGAADLARRGIYHRHRLAGIVDEQPLAAGVDLAHRALQPLGPGAVLLAVRAVAVGPLPGA